MGNAYTPRNATGVIASIPFFVVWWLTRALCSALPDYSGPHVFVSRHPETPYGNWIRAEINADPFKPVQLTLERR
jgi:hypothetical protein